MMVLCRGGLFWFVLNFIWCVDDRIFALERDVAKLRVHAACSNDPRLFFYSGVVT
jgi:hypothetical protein